MECCGVCQWPRRDTWGGHGLQALPRLTWEEPDSNTVWKGILPKEQQKKKEDRVEYISTPRDSQGERLLLQVNDHRSKVGGYVIRT